MRNLLKNQQEIYLCKGRNQGVYPIYIPPGTLFEEKLVEMAHLKTLHGGVGLTMTYIRESYWIPKLRQLTKRIIRRCHGCIRFRAVALAKPPTAPLPTDRTEGYRPF